MFRRRIDLQAKIVLVLVAVILPTFTIVTIAENQLTYPILEDEIRQAGLSAARNLAAEILSQGLLDSDDPDRFSQRIESILQEVVYSQPAIVRMDVVVADPDRGVGRIIASNVDDPSGVLLPEGLEKDLKVEFKRESRDSSESGYWEIHVPIERKTRSGTRKVLGSVRAWLTLQLIDRIASVLWKITGIAAAFSVIILVLALNYFLRKAVRADRRLVHAESQNARLSERLHEAQRQLMVTEKLAVMGQLTASFAHEIGTPLNAIGGHLQLLKDDLPSAPAIRSRFDILQGQVSKIEQIVKGFLQSTANPSSQKQLTDLNQVVEKTLGLVWPRIEALQIDVDRDLERKLGPAKVVPIELEQILLNVMNNALDSLSAKAAPKVPQRVDERLRLSLSVSSRLERRDGVEWVTLSIKDSGTGIPKEQIKDVFKPFFTTKRPGEGTGLGLTISQELAKKHGGMLEIRSREGSWTQVTLRLPA